MKNVVIWRVEENPQFQEKWDELGKLIESSRPLFRIFNLEPKFVSALTLNKIVSDDLMVFAYRDEDYINAQVSLEQLMLCFKSVLILNYYAKDQYPNIWVYTPSYSCTLSRVMRNVHLYNQVIEEIDYHPPHKLLQSGGIKYQDSLNEFNLYNKK